MKSDRKTNKKSLLLQFFLIGIIFLFTINNTFALGIGVFYEKMSDIFGSTIDENEGLTSFRSMYIPFGGRAEAMGSAFTALSNDICFLEYNPGASSTLENTELAVFHNSWIADSALETLAFTTRKNNFGFGTFVKLFYVPFTEYNIFGERVATGYYSETTAALNLSYNFLAGYTFKGFATGITLKGSYRSVPNFTDNNTNEIITGSGFSQSAIATMADIGLQLRFNFFKFYISRQPNFNIGLSLTNVGVGITGLGNSDGILFDDPLPTKASLGVSYQMIRPVIITGEFQQPLNLFNILKSEKWSVGIGTHIQFTNFFAFEAGLLLRGANPRFSIGAEVQVNQILLNLNYTLDLTTSLNPLNRISLAAKLSLGDGGRQKIQEKIDAIYAEGLSLYTNGYLEQAIKVWEEILIYNKHYDPALNGIAAAESTIRLQQRIRDIQTLD